MGRWRPSLQRRHLDFQHEQNRSGFHGHRQATPICKGMGEVFPWLPRQQLFAHPDKCLLPSVHKPRIPAGHVTPSAPPATTPYLGNTELSSSRGLKLQPHPCPRTLGSWPPLPFTRLRTWRAQRSAGGPVLRAPKANASIGCSLKEQGSRATKFLDISEKA